MKVFRFPAVIDPKTKRLLKPAAGLSMFGILTDLSLKTIPANSGNRILIHDHGPMILVYFPGLVVSILSLCNFPVYECHNGILCFMDELNIFHPPFDVKQLQCYIYHILTFRLEIQWQNLHCYLNVKLCSDQANANAKANIFFDVCCWIFDLFHFRSCFHFVWIDLNTSNQKIAWPEAFVLL